MNGTVCLANVAIGSFTPQSASLLNGQNTTLVGSNITGGGTVTCSIDQGLGPVQVVSGNVSKGTGTLTLSTTYTLTCRNGVVPDASKSTTVAVGSAPVNGVCSSTRNACTAGTSTNNVDGLTSYTWTCTGANGGTTASCSEAKPAPTATLSASPVSVAYNGQATLTWSSTNATSCTAGGPWSNNATLSGSGLTDPLTANSTFTFQCTGNGQTSSLQSVTVTVGAAPVSGTLTTPPSCIIAAEASTCTVNAIWTTANATNPQLVDVNTGVVLSSTANPSSPGLQVWIAYPSTIFNLKNGNTILATKTVNAVCAAMTAWNGTICAVILPDLTASLVAPASVVAGTSANYSATIANANAPIQVGFTNLFQRATNASGAGATDVGSFTKNSSPTTPISTEQYCERPTPLHIPFGSFIRFIRISGTSKHHCSSFCCCSVRIRNLVYASMRRQERIGRFRFGPGVKREQQLQRLAAGWSVSEL